MSTLTIRPREQPHFLKPGVHTHNVRRRLKAHVSRHRAIRAAQIIFFLAGLCGIGYYGYSLANERIYQAYENWAFEQHIAGRYATFADYLREKTPFGFLTGQPRSAPLAGTVKPVEESNAAPELSPQQQVPQGSVLGRVEIGRLNLSAIVREGVDESTLSRAVGHLPSTALPGQVGNFTIAAHRDTLFRALKDIQKDDEVKFESTSRTYTYKVISTKIVRPSDVSVIQPRSTEKLMTMITCYPFYYVGSAPKRFIVQAELLDSSNFETSESGASPIQSHATGPPGIEHAAQRPDQPEVGQAIAKRTSRKQPRNERGFSSSLRSRATATARTMPQQASASRKSRAQKKQGFWSKLLHRNHAE